MIIKTLSAAALLSLAAAGSAFAGDYGGTPPYEAAGYGYAGYDEGCGGFTLAGVRAGVTVLGVNLGAGVRSSIGGGCKRHGPRHSVQNGPGPGAQPPGYPPPGYSGADFGGFAPVYGGPGAYPVVVYAPPVVLAPVYAYAPPPCGCAPLPYVYAQPMGYGAPY